MRVVEVEAERHGVVDRALQLLRGGKLFKAELNRPQGGGGDREQELAVFRAPACR